MGSAPETSTLPIIDISPFLDPSATPEARKKTASAINQACVEFGFFYLKGHGIPQSKFDEIIDLARQFFALPPEEKNKIKRHNAGGPEGGDGARGYQGMGENVTGGLRDHHEALDLYREWEGATGSSEKPSVEDATTSGAQKTLQGPNLWPSHPTNLKPTYQTYITQLQHIGSAVVRAMGTALDLPSPEPNATKSSEDSEVFVRNTTNSFWVMRLIGYPPLPKDAIAQGQDHDINAFSCGTHSDYGCLTLLLADPTPGALQVLLKDNTTWLDADPIPGAFVVNIGDMMERWTNGIWKSTRHRVLHRGSGYRVSVPFFFEPNWDAVVRPLGKCVERKGGEGEYAEGTYGEHLLGKVFGNFA